MQTVFPLTMVRTCLERANRGFRTVGNWGVPASVVNAPAAKNVSCGSLPLSRVVFVSAQNRFNASRHCYIDSEGGFVYPG